MSKTSDILIPNLVLICLALAAYFIGTRIIDANCRAGLDKSLATVPELSPEKADQLLAQANSTVREIEADERATTNPFVILRFETIKQGLLVDELIIQMKRKGTDKARS